MKRIAIVTITNGGSNFGNRLQNYALQTVLEHLGGLPETIFTANIIRQSLVLSRLRWALRNAIKRTKRQYYFDAFNKRYIRVASRIRYQGLNDSDFSKNEYDAAIVGSDQVWNQGFRFNTDFEFLPFMPPEKRYAYAASFGTDEVPAHRYDVIADYLRQMNQISVRENSGRDIVKEMTGRDVPVHLDPTMLLTVSDYEALAEKPPTALPKRYLLTYSLGEFSPADRAFIDQMAEESSLPVLELNELPNSAFFNIGPQHFLYLIQNASYICTDSFHGTVFSILFHRPFTSFYRGQMNSRLDTLLSITGLESRIYNGQTPAPADAAIDYEAVDVLIDQERAKAMDYLQKITK